MSKGKPLKLSRQLIDAIHFDSIQERFIPLDDAKRKAWRSFWRGVMIGSVAVFVAWWLV